MSAIISNECLKDKQKISVLFAALTVLSPWLRQLSSPICTCQPCVGYWSVHYVLWEQSSSHVASFACSGSLFQMWMCCKGGHYRGFFVYAHYRSAQMSFIGAWGGGSNKMRCLCPDILSYTSDFPNPVYCSMHTSISYSFSHADNI